MRLNDGSKVRRNPVRAKKRKPDKSYPRPRQRLLAAAERRAALVQLEEHRKTGKTGQTTMPYMNTRSVTRKMYNVGATYRAPVASDALEWRDWPAHGMHERPIFHPKVGLAAEYLGKYFTSIDGFSYTEIVDPEVEVVSVDPRFSFERKALCKTVKPKSYYVRPSGASKGTESFGACMHGSLHNVLGYCSQVLTPVYRTTVEEKLATLNKPAQSAPSVKSVDPTKTTLVDRTQETVTRDAKGTKSFAQVAQVAQGPSQTLKPVPRLFPMQAMYVANTAKPVSVAKTGHAKIQESIRPPSAKNPLILVSAEARGGPPGPFRGRILKPVSGNLNFVKLEKPLTSHDQDNLVIEVARACKFGSLNEPSAGGSSVGTVQRINMKNLTLKPAMRVTEISPLAKYFPKDGKENPKLTNQTKTFQLVQEAESKDSRCKPSSSEVGKSWSATNTSDIAKILSEYNKTTKESQILKPSNSQSTYRLLSAVKTVSREELPDVPKNLVAKQNLSIQFPQGKWRRFHFTVEKMRPANTATLDPKKQKLEKPSTSQEIKPDCAKEGQKENARAKSDPGHVEPLQELLENTAVLYCSATGVHQEDLAGYIDSLDAKHSMQWLEDWSDSSAD